jgi:predicted nucleic acid-binding protein
VKVLFDTNIVLDVLIDRAPFAEAAVALFSAVEHGAVQGYLCGTTITTVHYLTARILGARRARDEIGKLMTLFEVAPVSRPVLESALAGDFADFEDAVLYQAACHSGAQAIVTRNLKDFQGAGLPVYSSVELVKILAVRDRLNE